MPKSDGFVITTCGQRMSQKITHGWRLLLKWADNREAWIQLKDIKESYPAEVAGFAKPQGIADQSAFFAWWVTCTLKKRDVMLSKVKAQMRKTKCECGIKILSGVEHEMQLAEVKKDSAGWNEATSHGQCEIWKSLMAAELLIPWIITCLLSCLRVHFCMAAFTPAALNDFDVFAGDVMASVGLRLNVKMVERWHSFTQHSVEANQKVTIFEITQGIAWHISI